MFGLFKKKKEFSLVAPVSGELESLAKVNDPVFAEKMMGDGLAFVPSSNEVLAPVSGEIISLPKSKHAVGIKTDQGIEVLTHIGLDTVNLNGEGFEAFVKEGEKVKQGQKMITFNPKLLQEKGLDSTVMVILTSGYDNKEVQPLKDFGNQVIAGDVVLK